MIILDFTQYVLLAAVIAGATEFITRLRARDFWVAATIAVAAAIGGVFGLLGVEGLPSVIHGVAAGLGASGAISILGSFGNKSSAVPRSITK